MRRKRKKEHESVNASKLVTRRNNTSPFTAHQAADCSALSPVKLKDPRRDSTSNKLGYERNDDDANGPAPYTSIVEE
jgi:hypothetical protein